MDSEVLEASIKGVMPASNGYAVFLGPPFKTIVIYVEQSIGMAISHTLNPSKHERPLTHDLIANILLGLDVTLERVLINDTRNGTFYARLILKMENELGKKWVEIDARPSDSIVLALQAKVPILITRKVLAETEDMTEVLERILKQEG